MREHSKSPNPNVSRNLFIFIVTLLASLVSISIHPLAQAQDLTATGKILSIESKQQQVEPSIDGLPFVSNSKGRDEISDFSTAYLRQHGTVLIVLTLLILWYIKRLVNKKTDHLKQEILKRSKVERELEEANAKYAKAEQMGKVGNWEYDIASQKFYGSREAKRIFGFKEDDVSLTMDDLDNCILQYEMVRRAQINLIQQHIPYDLEYDIRTKDTGEHRIIFSHGEVFCDELGTPLKIFGFLQDITERKNNEKALRESEEKHRTILQTAMDGFWLVDTRGNVLETNETYCQMSGYTMKEILGMRVSDFSITENKSDIAARIKRIISLGSERFETTHRRKDGSLFDVEVSIQYRTNNGGIFLCFLQDITKRKREERERKRLQAQLLQSRKMEAIGTLAGGIAHDFNNILGAIIGYAEMILADCPADSNTKSDISQILKASHRAKELVKKILDFSKQAETKKTLLQPDLLVQDTINLLRPTLPTNIVIKVNSEPGTGMIFADPDKIHQVLMNLCINAFHAMEQTGGNLTISLQQVVLTAEDLTDQSNIQPGIFMQLSIADTGPGIAPEILERIFEPYFTTKETGKGSGGLGLAIIHGIVTSHQGFIRCQNNLDKGAVFHVFLPIITKDPLPKSRAEGSLPAAE